MMQRYLKKHTNPPVFVVSAIVIVGFVLWGVIAPGNVAAVASSVNTFITTNFEWLYIIAATFFLVFVIALMVSRYGNVRLGPSDSRPEYGNLAWFAMLFTAGMGIGLVYFAVSEPVAHFLEPPVGPGGTDAAASNAMNLTFFHWGLHPWAIYIVLGLSLGYFTFRRGLPLRPDAAFYPLIGDRIYGWLGHLVDILAVFGTLFGLATSLGLGGQQVGAGLETLFGIPNSGTLQVVLILAITAVAVVSVMLGIDKGIRNLSLINLWLALVLMLFVFFLASSRDLLNALAANVGFYLQNLPLTSFETYPGDSAAQEWQSSWTLFYWGWWISWSPFVGMFIARISYGRTIRQFIAGALFAPVGASMVWLTVFGNSSLNLLVSDPTNPLATASSETAMFFLLDQLPVPGVLTTLSSVLAIIVVVLFFATSSDSGSLVVDILTNGGDPHPRWQQRLFWAVLEGVVAAVLLVVGVVSGEDALSALQTASILAGLPFCIVLFAMCAGLVRGLAAERMALMIPREPSPAELMRESYRLGKGDARADNGPDEQAPGDEGTRQE
ncbi:BCCT family transporter [Saccharopolyspora sp. HNM0986]|uniref:BCCT family transporter n=1 Tax=Saccharopolyspora galaxeae TaxID=2781241 RepID=UPI00190C77F5|nr:BCCT family transporter [Saccharopolyspora sp. HNM0986]MBK0868784.1 BCCT family transporter [Saccharopolyspora sp. HNM0986]